MSESQTYRNSPLKEGYVRVFDIKLHPNLENRQFTPTADEMAPDAFASFVSFVGGTDTVTSTLVVIPWALLNDLRMMQRLKAELRAVIPSREDTVDWAKPDESPHLASKEFDLCRASCQ